MASDTLLLEFGKLVGRFNHADEVDVGSWALAGHPILRPAADVAVLGGHQAVTSSDVMLFMYVLVYITCGIWVFLFWKKNDGDWCPTSVIHVYDLSTLDQFVDGGICVCEVYAVVGGYIAWIEQLSILGIINYDGLYLFPCRVLWFCGLFGLVCDFTHYLEKKKNRPVGRPLLYVLVWFDRVDAINPVL